MNLKTFGINKADYHLSMLAIVATRTSFSFFDLVIDSAWTKLSCSIPWLGEIANPTEFFNGVFETHLEAERVWAVAQARLKVAPACRIVDVVSKSDQHGISRKYPAPREAAKFIDDLQTVRSFRVSDPAFRLGLIYAIVIIRHPLLDGNGRFARVLVSIILEAISSGRLPATQTYARLTDLKPLLITKLSEACSTNNLNDFAKQFEQTLFSSRSDCSLTTIIPHENTPPH